MSLQTTEITAGVTRGPLGGLCLTAEQERELRNALARANVWTEQASDQRVTRDRRVGVRLDQRKAAAEPVMAA